MSVHGGNIFEAKERFGQRKYLDFSANINPFGAPSAIKEGFISLIENDLCNYPDPENSLLRRQIAEYHGINDENILCTNGASELLQLVFRGLDIKSVIVPMPSFCEYSYYARCEGASVLPHYTKSGEDFELFVRSIEIENADALILGNPNNPTSKIIPLGDMLYLAEKCQKLGKYLIVDEAFTELTIGNNSLIGNFENFDKLILVRAFTKSLAIPAVRLGYGIAHEALLKRLKKKQVTWSVNSFAQAAGGALNQIDDYNEQMQQWLKSQVPYAYEKMSQLGFKCYKPSTNFMLFQSDIKDFREKLAQKGFLIRPCANFEGLDDSYFRIAIKKKQENDLLYKEIESLLCGA